MAVSADDIELALHRYNFPCRIMIPRYTPRGWYEIDFLAITAAGYAREFEIKMSKADFCNDFSKGKRGWSYATGELAVKWVKNKHEQLEKRECFPSYYWFVCPDGVISVDQVPEYAGLMYVSDSYPSVVKQAPRLHMNPVPRSTIDHIGSIFGFRFWNVYRDQLMAKRAKKREPPTEHQKIRNRYWNRQQKIRKLRGQIGDMLEDIREYFATPLDEVLDLEPWEKGQQKKRRGVRTWKHEDWYRKRIRSHIRDVRPAREKLLKLEKLQEKDEQLMERKGIERY